MGDGIDFYGVTGKEVVFVGFVREEITKLTISL
jgi:hypothetical protein